MIVAFQPELRPELPIVFGAKDYRQFRATVEEMDRILTETGIEVITKFPTSELFGCGMNY